MPTVSKRNSMLFLRGSVIKVRRTCGNARCKCSRGHLHETWALSYSYQGRTRMIPLRDEDVAVARRAIQRYQKAIANLESKTILGIQRFHASIKAAKRRAR